MPAGIYKLHIRGVLPINEITVLSFGQISPLKKCVGGKDVILKNFFYYKRERESRVTRGKGWRLGGLALMGIK